MQTIAFIKTFTVSEKSQEADYLVAELIAQKRKSHLVDENMIMPTCKITVSKMLEEDWVRKTENIPLSNITVSRWINDNLYDVAEILFDKLKDNNFSIHVSESRDLINKCYVLAFVIC